MIRGLRSAGELVQSFKQVAVDRATEQRRTFDLLRTSQEVVATLQRSIQVAGHRLEMAIPEGIVLDGYPGPYGQVLTNLVNNATLHAFGTRRGGTMRLQAEVVRNLLVEVRFSDDGVGIAAENLKRIFDPFFTTKLGQGGSGLGMSISYNIVTSLFGGELEVGKHTRRRQLLCAAPAADRPAARGRQPPPGLKIGPHAPPLRGSLSGPSQRLGLFRLSKATQVALEPQPSAPRVLNSLVAARR